VETTQETTTTQVPIIVEFESPTTTQGPPPKTTIASTTTTTVVATTTTVPSTTTQPPTTTTTIPEENVNEVVTAKQAVDVVKDLLASGGSKEDIIKAVDQILSGEIDSSSAQELSTSPEVIQNISADQATEIFDAIVVSELTPEVAQEIVNAVQDAPEEVRKAFEEEINVFEGNFDSYTPTGSKVDVGTRRVVVAAGAAMLAAPAAAAAAASGNKGAKPK
jgi:hypothetical protein